MAPQGNLTIGTAISISLFEIRAKDYRNLINQNSISEFDFRVYLFARQSKVLISSFSSVLHLRTLALRPCAHLLLYIFLYIYIIAAFRVASAMGRGSQLRCIHPNAVARSSKEETTHTSRIAILQPPKTMIDPAGCAVALSAGGSQQQIWDIVGFLLVHERCRRVSEGGKGHEVWRSFG